MPQKNFKASDLNGLFIYHDPKKGTVYRDPVTKRAYIITNSDVKGYVVYSTMLTLSVVAAFALMSLFSLGYVQTLLILLALLLIVMGVYRAVYLPKLLELDSWNPVKRDDIVTGMAKRYTQTALIALAVMFLILTFMIPAYARMTQMDDLNRYASYAIAAFTGIAGIVSAWAAVIRKKNS